MPLAKTRDVIGVLAKTVSDIIKVDNVLVLEKKGKKYIDNSGNDFDLKDLRIGIPDGIFFSFHSFT